MSFLTGNILCIKTTGERVCVLGSDTVGFMVRRAVIGDGGKINHEQETFFSFELETVNDHAKRQVSEMILKTEAQVELIKAEQKAQAILEASDDTTTKPGLAIVPKPVLN